MGFAKQLSKLNWLPILIFSVVCVLALSAFLYRDKELTGPMFTFGVVVGTIGVGGIVLYVGITQYKKSYARDCFLQLHFDLLKILDLKEAWVLDGNGWREAVLLEKNAGNVPTVPVSELDQEQVPKHLHLRRVELRAVLDDAVWSARPDEHNFYFDLHSSGTRRWILREKLLPVQSTDPNVAPYKVAYRSGHGKHPHSRPALISSVGVEHLRGWIERYTELADVHSMTTEQHDLFDRWLMNLSTEDRRAWWGSKLLSKRAMRRLEDIDNKRGKEYRRLLADRSPTE